MKTLYKKQCPQCDKHYETVDKRQKYCNKECYYTSKKGEGNHFYGRKHTPEAIAQMKTKLSEALSGEKNPFYGKKHTPEATDKIRKANAEYRANNKELILEQRMKRKNLTVEQLKSTWEEYASTHANNTIFREKLNIDWRTARDLLVAHEIITKEIWAEIGLEKKMFLSGGVSAPEMKLLGLLNQEFGRLNVEHQKYLCGYSYDFCLFGKILVEYDGYYFHKVLPSNDEKKNKVAKDNGFILLRVEEDENRTVDWGYALNSIKQTINEKVKQ